MCLASVPRYAAECTAVQLEVPIFNCADSRRPALRCDAMRCDARQAKRRSREDAHYFNGPNSPAARHVYDCARNATLK
jgi:hypothetical protein